MFDTGFLAVQAAQRMVVQVRERHRKDGDPVNASHPEHPGGEHPVLFIAFSTYDLAVHSNRAEELRQRTETREQTLRRIKINALARRLAARHARGEGLGPDAS